MQDKIDNGTKTTEQNCEGAACSTRRKQPHHTVSAMLPAFVKTKYNATPTPNTTRQSSKYVLVKEQNPTTRPAVNS
jgi:hypothetical protein